jgi:dCTP deaminase
MSIIPFIRSGDVADWTVAANDDEFTKTGGTEGHAVLIRGLDHSQLADDQPNASYDLRVGPEYRDHRDTGKTDLPMDEEITLLPGAAVIIQTEEYVHFPRSRFGYIVPKVRLLQTGISNTVSKVDPGYDGPLLVTLFNLGKEKIRIKRLAPFCSLSIHHVEDGARLYNKPPKRIEGLVGRKLWRKITDALDAYHVIVLIALIIVDAILATVGIIALRR